MLTNLAEANIQAEFYHHCRLLGVRCVLEVSTAVGRLDAAIVSGDGLRLLVIVECKRDRGHVINDQTRQFHRYRRLGVPVLGLNKLAESEPMARRIAAEFTTGGILLTAIETMERKPRRQRRTFNPATDLDESVIFRP